MRFHVLTLFPELIEGSFATSITGRALEKGQISLNAVNIRDYAGNKHQKVDDYPYGGGAGMVMQAEPVYTAYENLKKKIEAPHRVIYVTPQGRVFDQELAQELAMEEELVFLCGHYEGIDERVLEEIVTDYVSIGDYVLTGGELPALVMMDAVSRLVPGVLNNDVSAEFESFHGSLLEYPQYSRPEVWHGKAVPTELMSGNHKSIEDWRKAKSIERTKTRRPDLYQDYIKRTDCETYLRKQKLLHMDMLESLRTDRGKIQYFSEEGVLLIDFVERICYVSAMNQTAGEALLKSLVRIENEASWKRTKTWKKIILHQEFLVPLFEKHFKDYRKRICEQWVYTLKNPISIRFQTQEAKGSYQINEAGILELIQPKEEDENPQNTCRCLQIKWMNQKVGSGATPIVWAKKEDEGFIKLQKELGLYKAKSDVWILKNPL